MKTIAGGNTFELRSGELRAEILTPWSTLYRKTRFARAGFVKDLWLGEICFTQPEGGPAGMTGTGGAGLCSEYKCPEIEMDSAVGAPFLKIGVGVLERTADPWTIVDERRVDGLDTTVQAGQDAAVFECVSPEVNGYAYREKRTLTLRGQRLRQEIELENRGGKPMTFSEYCHNFVSLGGLAIDETHQLELLCAKMLPNALDQPFIATPRGGGWTGPVEASFRSECEEIPWQGPRAWRLSSSRTSVSIAEDVDFEPVKVYLWGTPFCACAEVFAGFTIQPGETARWSREWCVTGK